MGAETFSRGFVVPATLTGSMTLVPVVSPVSSQLLAAGRSAGGEGTETEAVPASSVPESASNGVVVTGKEAKWWWLPVFIYSFRFFFACR